MQAELMGFAAGCGLVVAVAAVAERRRARADGMARVGWVPWNGIAVTALFAGMAALVFALH